jgi:hypothetical protein
MIDQPMNRKFGISKFASFLHLLPEFDSNLIEFGFCLFSVWLNHLIKSPMKEIKDFITRGVTAEWGWGPNREWFVGRLLWAPPSEQCLFRIKSNISNGLELIQSKDDLLLLEIFQIKYGCVGN